MLTRTAPDPLIDEVRERRQTLYASYGNDLSKVAEAIRELQSGHPDKVFDRRKHPPVPTLPQGSAGLDRPSAS